MGRCSFAASTALVTAACGRIAFDPLGGGSDGNQGFCAGSHVFCDDFERTSPLLGPWETSRIDIGALALDAGPPRSLLVTIPVHPGGLQIALEAPIPAPTTRTVLSFDLALEQIDMMSEVDLVQLRWVQPPAGCTPDYGLYFVKGFVSNIVRLQETYQGCGGLIYTDLPQTDQALHRYELEVEYQTDHVTVRRDGVELISLTAGRDLVAQPQRLRVGAPSTVNGTTVPWQLRHDNVVLDAE